MIVSTSENDNIGDFLTSYIVDLQNQNFILAENRFQKPKIEMHRLHFKNQSIRRYAKYISFYVILLFK